MLINGYFINQIDRQIFVCLFSLEEDLVQCFCSFVLFWVNIRLSIMFVFFIYFGGIRRGYDKIRVQDGEELDIEKNNKVVYCQG